jgi:cytochrome b6-f complex iron-sulfur subunit
MDRRNFIRASCLSCLGSIGAIAFLEACSSQKYINNYELKEDRIILRKSEFTQIKKEKIQQLAFVLVKVEQLPFPIAVYKLDDQEYKALFLQCTHQGCELNPHENMLVCPCHGAEFNTGGKVTQGPAEIDLKTFITSHDNENIYIHLV